MNTESLIKRLVEFQDLINKVSNQIGLSSDEKDITLEERLLELRQAVDSQTHATRQGHQADLNDRLFHRFLGIEKRLASESQQHLSLLLSILQNNPAGMAIVSGPDLSFQIATPTYYSALPFQQPNIVGKRYHDTWLPEQGFHGDLVIREFLESEKNVHIERIEERYPDGLIHRFSLHLLRLSWDNQPGALILLYDTTQADQAQQLTMEIAKEAYGQAEELDAIIMAMAEGIILFDHHGKAIRANPAAHEMFDIDPVGLDQQNLAEEMGMRNTDGSPLDSDKFAIQKALEGETVLGQHMLFIDSQGEERVVLVSAYPLFSQNMISHVVTVWHDVTLRENLLAQLEIEQSRLETIIENAPEGIVVADEEGRLVQANPAAERLLGRPIPYSEDYQEHVKLGLCYPDGNPYDPRNLPLTCSALDGERLDNVEIQTILPNGQLRHMLVSTAPIVDRKGNLNGAVGVFQDNTLRKQAENELRSQASHSGLLANLSQAFAEAGLNFSELLEIIVKQIGSVMGDMCSLHMFTEDRQKHYPAALSFKQAELWLAFLRDVHDIRYTYAGGLVGEVMSTGQPILYNCLTLKQFQQLVPPGNWQQIESRLSSPLSGLIVPLRVHGRWIGALNVLRFQSDTPYHKTDQLFLQDLADRAAFAVEDARLYDREARRARELQALNQATTILFSTLDLETLPDQIIKAAQNAFPAAGQGALYLMDENQNTLELRASFGIPDQPNLLIQMERQAAAAVKGKKSLILSQVSLKFATGSQHELQSLMVAPLILSQRVLGSLVLIGTRPNLFNESDIRLIDSFSATAAAAMQNAMLYNEVQRLATTDTLTQQHNRRRFFELGEMEMHRFRRFHIPLSAIMFDIDHFKEINDSHGHNIGDQVLHHVAQRCKNNIRVIDILGRYGGDEFAILLPDARLKEAVEIADRIRQSVTAKPIQTSIGAIEISISLGVTQATSETESLSVLLVRADAALYSAKQNGRNRVAQG